MRKISDVMIASAEKYRISLHSQGLTMLEAVVVVVMILALSVGGFLTYKQVSSNAKKASVETAASSVYAAALAAESDGDSTTSAEQVQNTYNESQDKITVTITAVD